MGYLQSELTVVLCLRVSVLVRPTRISPRQSGRDREAVHSIPLRGVHTVSAAPPGGRGSSPWFYRRRGRIIIVYRGARLGPALLNCIAWYKSC